MADLVLGLATSAVKGTITAARSALEAEEKLKKGMQRDLMLISDEFEMMHSFLSVAKDGSSDEMAKTLIRQVRNMALDVEDCIESVVLVDTTSHWWRRLLPSCMVAAAPAKALDDAVTDIELLKSRVEAMGQRNERYRHISDSAGSKTTEKMHQQAVADAAALGILKEARAKKKNSSSKDLVELIKKDHVLPLQVFSVWGAVGDLGVASIIKKTRDDLEICSKFSCRAWVKLPQPFNIHLFIRSLMAQFYTNCCPQQGSPVDLLKRVDVMMAMEDTRLIEEFVKEVSDQRFIVFLEEVSSTVEWEAVRLCLPDRNNGSRIVVHTQQLEVASLCVGQSHRVLELEQFSADHSVCVFFNEKHSSPRDLMELINKKFTDHTPLQVISVCGEVGNLEVASIMKKTCDDDPEICKKFRCRASVKMTHPFSHHEFIGSLLSQLCTNYCPRHGSAEDFLRLKMVAEGVLIEEIVKQVMTDQRYLVFLEDVACEADWDAARKYLPDKNNGSCIIVHTQKPEVATLCVGQSHHVLEPEQFSAEHSVPVLFKEVEDEMRDNRTETAREWLQNNQLVGRVADIEYLCANDPEVQPVFGIAGVGKSYIVRHVYYKKMTEDTHFEKFGWVEISHPFNIRDFSWSLLLDLHSGSLQHSSMLRIRDPIQECHEILQKHTCLIVIDGLKSTEEWDQIKNALAFEDDKNQSRIIVIANEEKVATYCSKYTWSVEGLEIEDALTLFKETPSNHTKSLWTSASEPSHAEIENVKIGLHKCGGLPKVIIAVANFMADYGWFHSWDDFIERLENQPEFGSLRDLFSWVHSYFHSCSDLLKPCIFYLSIFPVNHNIGRRRLVRRWVAEGYSMDTKEMNAEECAEKDFRELLYLNMVHVPGSTNFPYITSMSFCQVNGFFREYIISRSMEENLVFALKGHCGVNSQHTGRHLTIESTWDRDRIVYESIDFSHLRSLTVFGKWESFFISDKMRLLRVLDLEDASSVTDDDLELIVKLLLRLKFLSLRGRKEITRLPDSIGGLRQLQTLDIRYTSVVTLPISITKLQKLQHIRAGTTIQLDQDAISTVESLLAPAGGGGGGSVSRLRLPESWTHHFHNWRSGSFNNGGVEVPPGIGKMVALHNISVIDVSVPKWRAILEELKNLTQLRKLGVSGVKRENCKELWSAISGHPHLQTLYVWLDRNQDGCLDAISPPPEELESLKLYGCVEKLPSWIKRLPYLSKLKLQMDIITQEVVELLMNIPWLETLCLSSKKFQYGELRFGRAFRWLQVLEISCNSNLAQDITFVDDVMPRLQALKIRCSNASWCLEISGIKQLGQLREVSLSGSYDDKVKQRLQSQLGEHQRKVIFKSWTT